MTNEELLKRLRNFEDNWVERKPDNPKREEVRRTLTAFANSVQDEERPGLLFVGVSDKGELLGVANPDAAQKRINQIVQECYPEIVYRIAAIPVEGKQVLVS